MTDKLYNRQSRRLEGYDYTGTGAYFVTICAENRRCVFGRVVNGEMELSELGKIVESEWGNVEVARSNVKLDQFVVMPNHFHGIIWIVECKNGTASCASTMPLFGYMVSGSLSAIIRSFKSGVTNHFHKLNKIVGKNIWQRNFYDHIIRDEQPLNRIREYIINNPLAWEMDQENPKRKGENGFYSWMASFKSPPKRP